MVLGTCIVRGCTALTTKETKICGSAGPTHSQRCSALSPSPSGPVLPTQISWPCLTLGQLATTDSSVSRCQAFSTALWFGRELLRGKQMARQGLETKTAQTHPKCGPGCFGPGPRSAVPSPWRAGYSPVQCPYSLLELHLLILDLPGSSPGAKTGDHRSPWRPAVVPHPSWLLSDGFCSFSMHNVELFGVFQAGAVCRTPRGPGSALPTCFERSYQVNKTPATWGWCFFNPSSRGAYLNATCRT